MPDQTHFRNEHDLLGDQDVPSNAYYGIQTQRAMENFSITDIPLHHFPKLIQALAVVKKACAVANHEMGSLDARVATAIFQACDEIIDGQLHGEFCVDMIQGGAGTSSNMNVNEVIANRALELLGQPKGRYEIVHPNNHVNLAQSTNDAYPTALRVAILLSIDELTQSMRNLIDAFDEKSVQFEHIVKMGRTQLQDAVPMTLGQEFGAFRDNLSEDIDRINDLSKLFREVNLGATAIGTGINTQPGYANCAVTKLADITGIPFVLAANLVEATFDTGAFVTFSSVLKRVAVKTSKICNDLRLLSSGPRTGIGEINLPPMQPGSSIMPGKVNPVIPEVVNQVAYQVIGNDLTVTLACESGQLQLNAFEPVIIFNILQSMRILTRAMNVLSEKCVSGITANEEHCKKLIENSIGIITALNPHIGYENSTRIAQLALTTNQSIASLILKEELLSKEQLDEILKPENMTRPNV
ncbi:aspartate ammonia-lyase [Terasakiella sp. A23]|uniref:aspartate ammonia-lyase n=1 Tax=Terasakiella sp. FCG-A23 TaxID=3080561 RepID=UPI0029544AA2|nr:aspartate ammonia-lyase [Terasakiella sp. A23]MDV7341214.1 aspartate ammonia-lyase [Terasakiella sp. A23]